MSSHFPIFVDVLSAPPLVIGDSDVLTPKIRLLLKIAPVVDVVATLPSTFWLWLVLVMCMCLMR